VVQIIFSQLPNFHELWWLSVIGQTLSGTAYTCNCLNL
jgi:hypothetical protein